MISFSCPCGKHRFHLPDDEGGSMVQCPRCSRLNDVPTHEELSAMDIDGTLKVGEVTRNTAGGLADQMRTFGRTKQDASGNEIDLRQTFDDLRRAGSSEVPLEFRDEASPSTPKYDPLTGELVVPLDLKPLKPRAVLTVGATREARSLNATAHDAAVHSQGGLTYARAGTPMDGSNVNVTLASLPGRLFEPLNFFVVALVGVGSLVAAAVTLVPLMGGIFIAYGVPVIIVAIMLSHYANCIEELGPEEQEELPRPLRSFDLTLDLWWPFVRMFVSLMLCFGPGWFFLQTTGRFPAVQFVGSILLGCLGGVFFPVVALILCASSHFGNLRPDRVLTTLAVFGWSYLPTGVIVLSAVAMNVITVLLLVITLGLALLGGAGKSYSMLVGFGLTAIASAMFSAYLAHLACWWLGILYRRNESQLPWEFEELERARVEDKRLKVLAEIEKSRKR